MKKKPSKYFTFFFVPLTIVVIIFTFAILSEIPKTTVMGIDVFAGRIGFTLSLESNGDEEVSLLNSVIWSTSLSTENFMPFSLTIDSLYKLNEIFVFENPLMITPNPMNSRVTFHSGVANISIQNIFANIGSRITAEQVGKRLLIEIENSSERPWQELSFQENVKISIQACTVTDNAGNDLTHLFTDTVSVKLHKKNKSMSIFGIKDGLTIIVKDQREILEKPTQFLFKLPIENPDFSKINYQTARREKQSTIDSIFVKRKFPLESKEFTSKSIADLEMIAEPNEFYLYDFSRVRDYLRIRIGGKLNSLIISEGAIKSELVPGYLSALTNHPTTALIITWLGWLAFLIPLFSKLKNLKEGNK